MADFSITIDQLIWLVLFLVFFFLFIIGKIVHHLTSRDEYKLDENRLPRTSTNTPMPDVKPPKESEEDQLEREYREDMAEFYGKVDD